MSFTNQETMNTFLFLFQIHSESRYPGSELAQSDRRKISQFLLAATNSRCTFCFRQQKHQCVGKLDKYQVLRASTKYTHYKEITLHLLIKTKKLYP